VPELERAIALDPRDPQFKQHLNEVRHAQAEEEAAARTLGTRN
jgi:thioredoxin-like negative regulator of GroEL